MSKTVAKGKALVQSKTFWFNLLAVVTAIAMFLGFDEYQPTEEVKQFLGLVTALGNIYLRLKTEEPITKLK